MTKMRTVSRKSFGDQQIQFTEKQRMVAWDQFLDA